MGTLRAIPPVLVAPVARGHNRALPRPQSRAYQSCAWLDAKRVLKDVAGRWALAHHASDGSLPSGLEIARQHGRHERWGRLVKTRGRGWRVRY
jgi:hypothetical protein